jgi:predicted XRE-type DNA-binding protein
MGFPGKAELKKVTKRLSKTEGSLALGQNATPLEKFRFDLCQKFIKYKLQNEINQKEIASLLGVDEAKVSKILRHRIDEFSTDRLIDLYQRLDPDLKLRVG